MKINTFTTNSIYNRISANLLGPFSIAKYLSLAVNWVPQKPLEYLAAHIISNNNEIPIATI